MARTPEGYAVHDGEGCIGEIFSGVLGCWHSKENFRVMTSLVPFQGGGAVIEHRPFTDQQIQTLKNTICRGATDAELEMFTFACQETGLDPFLKQIWAIPRNVKVSKRGEPDRYEQQMAIQIGIDGYRVMRDRIRDAQGVPLFEGMEGPQWSPNGKDWYDFPDDAAAFARVAIWRRGIPRAFTATCRMDAYRQQTPLWDSMAPEQLAKCAEALALRRAFPAEMSKMTTIVGEAIAGQDLDDDIAAAIDAESRVVPSAFASTTVTPEAMPDEEAQAPKPQPTAAQSTPAPAKQGSETPAAQKTPPAPRQAPAAPKAETPWAAEGPAQAIARILSEISQSTGREHYGVVAKDLVTVYPFLRDPDRAGRFRPMLTIKEDLAPVLARLRIWQRGEDPNAIETQQAEIDDLSFDEEEPAEGVFRDADGDLDGENVVACANCGTTQILAPDADTNTPCASCEKPVGVLVEAAAE